MLIPGLRRLFAPGPLCRRDDLLYAASVLLWARWFTLGAGFLEVHYRVDYGALSHGLNSFYALGFLAGNGYVQHLISRRGTVRVWWLFVLSVLDVVAISFSVSLSGGFDSPYFPLFFVSVATFAYVFTSPRVVFSWTAMVAAVYTVLSFTVGGGMDLESKAEQHLYYRLVFLFGVAAVVCFIASLERDSRCRIMERERELQRQRIEMSQTIHDTTAQWAYMVGLGVDQALDLVGPGHDGLRLMLGRLSEVSRSAMWDLRHPIDGGQIFRGQDLVQVLEVHASTFSAITSVPAELVQRGVRPSVPIISGSLLFSIAHNALTNVFRHAGASRATVVLECDGSELRLSVEDDGGGLAPGYERRGHGFRNMRADAERMGGALEVDSGPAGTTVTCVVPYPMQFGGV